MTITELHDLEPEDDAQGTELAAISFLSIFVCA